MANKPLIVFLSGLGLLIVAILIAVFLSNEKYDTGPAFIILAIAIVLIFIAVIWYLIERDKKKKTVEEKKGEQKETINVTVAAPTAPAQVPQASFAAQASDYGSVRFPGETGPMPAAQVEGSSSPRRVGSPTFNAVLSRRPMTQLPLSTAGGYEQTGFNTPYRSFSPLTPTSND